MVRSASSLPARVRLSLETLEDRTALSAVRILDNGSPGFTTQGAWPNATTQGHLSDIAYSAKGVGSDVATWKFVVPAGRYRVSATWTAAASRATNAPYTVWNGAQSLGTVFRNQEIAPNDFADAGTNWERLGDYSVTGSVLRVTLSDFANDFVMADAIRIERLSPALAVGVEPFENGAVVYESVAPRTATSPREGMLALRLSLRNLDADPARVNRLEVSFPGSAVAARNYTLDVPLDAGAQSVWNFRNHDDVDDRIRWTGAAPAFIRLKLFGDGYTEPRTLTYSLKAHVSPVAGGSYNFPARASDLRVGEYWSGSSNHSTGFQGSQLFAYDLGVVAYDATAGRWSGVLPGTDGTQNAHSRVWGKPIYAAAAGIVLEVVNNVPSNPHPLQWSSQEELDMKKAQQRDLYWGTFTNGHAGNHVYVKHGDEVVLYAHLQTGSIPNGLFVGKVIPAGAYLGLAGNSGNSTGPHLHLHVMQGNAPESGTLRPMPFRNTWVIDRTAVTPGTPLGPWVRAEDQALPSVTSAIWPAATAPTWYPPGAAELSKHGLPAAQFQTEFNRITSSGYRMVAVDGYNVGGQVFFNLIFRPQTGIAWVSRVGMTTAQYQAEFNLRVGQGYRLTHVDAFQSGGAIRYAAIFTKVGGPAWAAYHGLTAAQHQARFNQLTAQGYRPVNISGQSIGGVIYYAALYDKRDVGTSFVTKNAMTQAEHQAEFDANAAAGRKLAYLNAYTHNGSARFSAIWYQKGPSSLVARHGLTSAQYQAEFNTQLANGLLTRHVTGYEEGGEMRFAALWSN